MASQVTLKGITRELMHLYYQDFQRDPDIFMDMGCFSEFCYDPKAIDLRFDRYIQAEDRRSFFIMDGAFPVGEICLKEIDPVKKQAIMSIHLQNDSVKNRGIGTATEKLILAYAFDQMNFGSGAGRCRTEEHTKSACAREGRLRFRHDGGHIQVLPLHPRKVSKNEDGSGPCTVTVSIKAKPRSGKTIPDRGVVFLSSMLVAI